MAILVDANGAPATGGGGVTKVPTYTVPILKAAPTSYPTPTPAPPLVPAPGGGVTPAIPVPGVTKYTGPPSVMCAPGWTGLDCRTPVPPPPSGVTKYTGPLAFVTDNGEPTPTPAPGATKAAALEEMAAVRAAAVDQLAIPPLLIAGAAMLALWFLSQARRSR